MRRLHLIAVAFLVLLVSMTVSIAAAAPPGRVFVAIANLSGSEEVPPRDTAASGVAVYRVSPDGLTLHYQLVAVNLTTNPVAAHIHSTAPRGVNAGVVAFLFPANPTSTCSSTSAIILRCEGFISTANLQGSLAGQPLSALLAQMAAGNTYTNVHTTRFPGGEERGQNETKVNIIR